LPAPEPKHFHWEGLDRHGQPQRGVLQASDEAQARAQLRRQGLRVARLRREAGSVGSTTTRVAPRKPSRARISDKQIALFTRQLATMLLGEVRQQVSRGDSLHAALQRHPRHFDGLFCNLVRAAEEAGMLDSMLERIALYREKSLALRGKVRAALAYPGAVVLVAIVVTAVIMLWVVPAFEQMFQQFGAELPLPTRIVMNLARVLGRYWPMLLLGLAVSGLLALHAWRRYPALRARVQRLSLSLPIFGRLLRQAALARWSRTFGTLFGAGIALVEALETVAGAAGNVVFAEASLAVRDAVRNGASLHGAMQATGVFPDLAVQMTAVGEEAGALDAMLGKIAELNEREVDEAVSALTSLMEPVIMAVLGVVIGGLVVAMYLPVFRMGSVV